jgi:hypothetical protein
MTMMKRQRGALNLVWVAIVSAGVAAAAMAALWSMRYDRNLFAEGVDKLAKSAPALPAQAAAPMRKCKIDGKTVISNTDCKDGNKTSRAIDIVATSGVEAPKAPVAAPVEATSDPALDKIIEKQVR